MKDRIEFIRLAIILLVLFFIGKLVVGALGGSYDLGNRLFAMVPMTVHLALLWGAMTRAFRGEGAGSAFMTGASIAIVAQLLIFSATMLSYLLGASTHFNDPMAIVGEAGKCCSAKRSARERSASSRIRLSGVLLGSSALRWAA